VGTRAITEQMRAVACNVCWAKDLAGRRSPENRQVSWEYTWTTSISRKHSRRLCIRIEQTLLQAHIAQQFIVY
jgi:hypothetical protein